MKVVTAAAQLGGDATLGLDKALFFSKLIER